MRVDGEGSKDAQPERRAGPHFRTGLRTGVEACGRHPFATGLFAILGLVGFAFSLYTFGVDRRDARQGDAGLAAVGEAVENINRELASFHRDESDAKLVQPLLVEVRDVIDNVTFQADETEIAAMSLSSDAAAAMMARIEGGERHFSSTPDLWFTVRSRADKHEVQIAPYLLLDIRQVTRLAPTRLAAIFEGGRGAEGMVRTFEGVLLPLKGLHVAPLANDDGGYARADYLSLAPGEVEEVFLSLRFAPGYVYEFRVGVQTRFDGRDGAVWLPGTFTRGAPDAPLPIYDFASTRFVRQLHPDAMAQGRPVSAEDMWRRRAADIAHYDRARIFSLEQAGLNAPAVRPGGTP